MTHTLTIAGRSLEEWAEFARLDYCLARMVPSDLRLIVSSHRDALTRLAAAEAEIVELEAGIRFRDVMQDDQQ